LGSTIHLIHAVSVEHELNAGRNAQVVQVAEIEIEQAHRLTEALVERGIKYVNQLQAQLKEAGVKVDDRANVPQGDPAQRILDYVKASNIDLVVMSTHGHGGLRRLLVGSVTDRLIQTCEIPILVNPCSE
jgi:nucleotide-binding universal stress UspA family protein